MEFKKLNSSSPLFLNWKSCFANVLKPRQYFRITQAARNEVIQHMVKIRSALKSQHCEHIIVSSGRSFSPAPVKGLPKQLHVDEAKRKYVMVLLHRLGIQEGSEAFAFTSK